MPRKEKTAAQKYVFCGVGSIHTEEGVRKSVREGGPKARAFRASRRWLSGKIALLRSGKIMLASEWESKALERESGETAQTSNEEE